MYHRFLVYVCVAAVVSLVLLVGLQYSELEELDMWRRKKPEETSSNETVENATPLPSTTLVLATLSRTDSSWVEDQLGDLLNSTTGNLSTAIYVVDNETAPLHTPTNKGHEAMAYLTYIIDAYDSLPEISVFMHGHPIAWHNNYLLDMSSSLIVRHLNRDKVLRDGYFNLRCHWSPGCPEHLHPQETRYNNQKQEELKVKDAWEALFPGVGVPETLSQACCSQFAVSREAVQRMSRERYIEIRDWLLETHLSDYVTGRIFEYLWQFVFNETPVFCPDPRTCYCDGYGACFEDPDEYERFFDQVTEMGTYRKELLAWDKWVEIGVRDRVNKIVEGGPDAAEEGREARIEWLKMRVVEINEDLNRRKEAAFEAGRDAGRRERAIERVGNLTMENPKDGPPWWTK